MNSTKKNGTTAQIAGDRSHINYIRIKKRMGATAQIVRDRQLYYMLIPFFIWYILMYYMPMYGIQIAFKDYKPLRGITESEWVGLKHFINFFQNPYCWRVIRNTILINVYSIIVVFPLTIVFALLLNELRSKKFKTIVQTASYLPHFISTVIVVGLVISLLSPTTGIINMARDIFGAERIYFLAKPEYFRTIYITMGGWQGIGFGAIIYTSALCSIDGSLYEAARIDGAGRYKQFLHVTIPGIMPTIAIMLIMRIGSLMSLGMESIILLYQPITYETADVISSYVYRVGLESDNPQYSFAAAVGLFEGVVSLVLVLLANKFSKAVTETSLF